MIWNLKKLAHGSSARIITLPPQNMSHLVCDEVGVLAPHVPQDFYFVTILEHCCVVTSFLWRSRRSGHYNEEKHVGIEMAEIYWHFVDIIWIVLFSLLYILTLF